MNPRRRLMLKTRAKKNAEVAEPVVVEAPEVVKPAVGGDPNAGPVKDDEKAKMRKLRAYSRMRKSNEEYTLLNVFRSVVKAITLRRGFYFLNTNY